MNTACRRKKTPEGLPPKPHNRKPRQAMTWSRMTQQNKTLFPMSRNGLKKSTLKKGLPDLLDIVRLNAAWKKNGPLNANNATAKNKRNWPTTQKESVSRSKTFLKKRLNKTTSIGFLNAPAMIQVTTIKCRLNARRTAKLN